MAHLREGSERLPLHNFTQGFPHRSNDASPVVLISTAENSHQRDKNQRFCSIAGGARCLMWNMHVHRSNLHTGSSTPSVLITFYSRLAETHVQQNHCKSSFSGLSPFWAVFVFGNHRLWLRELFCWLGWEVKVRITKPPPSPHLGNVIG